MARERHADQVEDLERSRLGDPQPRLLVGERGQHQLNAGGRLVAAGPPEGQPRGARLTPLTGPRGRDLLDPAGAKLLAEQEARLTSGPQLELDLVGEPAGEPRRVRYRPPDVGRGGGQVKLAFDQFGDRALLDETCNLSVAGVIR
jgi:hypothetical protein